MGERMAGESGVVVLDIEFILFLQSVFLQERVGVRAVEIVHVLHRLARLRLDQENSLEADFVLILGEHREESGILLELLPDVGVQDRLIPFPAAPEDVVVPLELMRDVHRLFHLGAGAGKNFHVGVRRGARHIAGMPRQVGRSPEKLDLRPLHLPMDLLGDLFQRSAGGRDVDVVEGEVLEAHFLDEFKSGEDLVLRRIEPGAAEYGKAERIDSGPAEGVPKADGDPEMLFHRFAVDFLLRIVIAVVKRLDFFEKFHCFPNLRQGFSANKFSSISSRETPFVSGTR